ncbi:MAG: hypothetical protein RLZZ399_2223 [Verrucomicrobiota bacterium]|jgi:uncharacterized membrane protein/mono/diheme cytochrome c family protein
MKRLLLLLLCLSSLCAPARAASTTPEEAIKVTDAVFQLFDAKCNDCHGAHLEKPKGDFGYVMDFQRIAANREYIVSGNPEKSEFYQLVNKDEMPGKKSKVEPATEAEKAALKRWIEIGAPATLSKEMEARRVALLGKKESSGQSEPASSAAKTPQPFLTKLLAYLGRFHAASTHFPIGLLTVAVLSEALARVTKKESWLTCTRFLLLVGAAGAVGTAILGWLNEYAGVTLTYKTHKWLGTATAIWGVISAGCSVLFECRENTPERSRLRVTLVIGALMVALTGFLGGTMVYKWSHYYWN